MAFASSLASLFSDLKIDLVMIPRKKPSILRIVCMYFSNLRSLALELFSMWPKVTWESVLMIARLTESVRSFDRANMIASYSMLLFVHWNSSFAAYLSLIPAGEVKIAAIPKLLLYCACRGSNLPRSLRGPEI